MATNVKHNSSNPRRQSEKAEQPSPGQASDGRKQQSLTASGSQAPLTDSTRGLLDSPAMVDWERCLPDDYDQAARYALSSGAYSQARQIARVGSTRYPDNIELQRLVDLLAEPRVLDSHGAPQPGVRANKEWLLQTGPDYLGQWVALRDGILIAAAHSLRELVQQVEEPKGLLLTKVD